MSTWLEERRATAAEQSEALGVPSLSDEHWRFTSLRGVDFAAFTPAVPPPMMTTFPGRTPGTPPSRIPRPPRCRAKW